MDEAIRCARVGPVDRRGWHRGERHIEINGRGNKEHKAATRYAFPLGENASSAYDQHDANQDGSDTGEKIKVAQDIDSPVVRFEHLQKAGALREQPCDE